MACAAPTKEKHVWNDLTSENPDIRKTAAEEVLATRKDDAGHILELAEKHVALGTRNGTVKDLMLLLGRLHAAEAVPFLVRNLTYEVFYKETKRLQTLPDLCPAVQALADIGSPALDPVLERAKAEDAESIHRAAAWVWRTVLGADRAEALLSREIAKASDPAVQARLRHVHAQLALLP
jgi:hypothetical protein